MTPQGKRIGELLTAAGLRSRGAGATTVTYRSGVTRVDWNGDKRTENLRRCAEVLRATGYHVEQRPSWACLQVSAQRPLNLFPQDAAVLEGRW